MAERMFRPGYRGPGGRKMGGNNSRLTENRIAWVEYGAHKVLLMRYEDGDPGNEDSTGEVGCNFVLMIKQAGKRPTSINLGSLTEQEIHLMREFFDLSFHLATPVAAARDAVAKEAANAGDDSYARVYRPVPKLVKRQGAFGPDGSSVHNGLEDLPERLQGGCDRPDGGVRGVRPDLASDEPREPGTEDHTSSSD